MLQVAIEERPETRVFAVRHVGPYNQIGRAFQTLHEIVTSAGLRTEALVGLFHDDPRRTPPAQLRSDAGVIVAGSAGLPEGLVELRLPAGRYARTDHVGSYAGLGAVWTRLLDEWLPQSGYRLDRGLTFEIYLNTPGTVPEAELRTALYAQISQAAKGAS
jgi:AraC family transcriptional regulator